MLCLACWAWLESFWAYRAADVAKRGQQWGKSGQKHCKARRKKRWKADALARQHANKERYYRIRFRLSPTAPLK
jgi:hypothetical protein